ncbi:MAG TPA: hypothetical protein VGL86_24110 [Polyangia bacterium]|jgi:hypothetical protein
MKPALLLIVAAAAGATGCASNDVSLSIIQMEAISRSTSCVAVAAGGAGTLGRDRGTLDVSQLGTAGYLAVPVLRNNLMSLSNGAELNAIQTTGANVKLMNVGGSALTLPSGQSSFFYAASAGRLDPGGAAPMFVEALPAAAAKALASNIPSGGVFTVIAELKPVGMRENDQVVGGPIDFPIDLCEGCLEETSTCPLPKGSTPMDPCFPGQDDPTVCCTDSMTGVVSCGSAAPVAM